MRIVLVSLCCGLFCSQFLAADEDSAAKNSALAKQLRELDSRVIVLGTVRQPPLASMLSRHAEARLRQANRASSAEWVKIKTLSDWEAFRQEKLQALKKSLGEFPEPPRDLKVKVTGFHGGDGYRVENLVYESRPGLIVTANLYRPAKPADSQPGIIICHSHQSTKHSGWRQDMGMTWARAGCTVLIPDHLGHGERRQHPFGGEGQHDYHFRYDLGMQLHLVGESLMGWLVWDLMRGVDVLLKQPGVDPKRIVMISEPAGGGDVAAVTGALDERISCVMVQNFGGPQPETAYPLPPDAEESFPYAGSGSWESTRNLRNSACSGFLPWVIVASIAPRKLIYFHEFYWDRHQDPVWERLQQVYRLTDKSRSSEHVVGLAGRGFVVGSAPENTHWLPECRELLYGHLELWLGIRNPRKEYSQRLPEQDLHCLTPSLADEWKPRPVHTLLASLAEERLAAARQDLELRLPRERPRKFRGEWQRIFTAYGSGLGPGRGIESEQVGKIRVLREQIDCEPGIVVPMLCLLPPTDPGQRVPGVICVAQQGKAEFLKQRAEGIAELLTAGIAVCLLDVRGTGETSPGPERDRRSAATSISSSGLMLGEPLISRQLRELLGTFSRLESLKVDTSRIALWGESFTPLNAADTDFAVPHTGKRPTSPEPMGGLLAIFGALFEDKVRAVYVHRGVVDYQSAVANPFCYLPHDAILPELLTKYDLNDLAAELAPRELHFSEPVDALNRAVSAAEAAQRSPAKNLTFTDQRSDVKSPSKWLIDRLTK